MNARHGETVKLHDGYISMHECRKYVFHSTYTHACTATDYIKEVSKSLVEDILNCKLDFKYFQYRVADFQETKWCAANITIDNINPR